MRQNLNRASCTSTEMVQPEQGQHSRRCLPQRMTTKKRIHYCSHRLSAATLVLITTTALILSSLVAETAASALPAISAVYTTKRTVANSVLLASSSTVVAAPTAGPSSSSTSEMATAAAGTAAAAAAKEESSPNAVVQMVVYLKNSVQRTVLGVGQLFSNHRRCNEIRTKIKLHQDKVRTQWEQQGLYDDDTKDSSKTRAALDQKLRLITGGISYEEFLFLQKGKEDRSKIMTLGFIMFGAPKIFPYMLMFNQNMMPSPLVSPDYASKGAGHMETLLEAKSRERTAIILKMLLQMERDARVIPQLAQLNIFGRKQQQAHMEHIASLNAQGMNFLQTIGVQSSYASSSYMSPTIATSTTSTSSSDAMDMTGGGRASNYGAQRLLNMLEPYLYQAGQDFDRASQRLCHVPASIIRGLGNAATGHGGMLDAFLPAIMARSKLLEHVKKVETADQFIVHAKIDLTTISPRLLREACTDRLIGGPGCSSGELRLLLQEWLTLTVQVPEQRLKGGKAGTNKLYYNGNLARTALMGYYGLQAVQDSRCASALPRLVFAGQHYGTSASGNGSGMDGAPLSATGNGRGWRSWR